jgi:hypothetical protein
MFRITVFASLFLCLASNALAVPASYAVVEQFKPTETRDKTTFAFSGKVAKVDYAANVVELVTKGRRVTVVVEPTTAIDVAGAPGSVSDIRPGVKMDVEGIVRDGTFIAQTITIHGGGKSKKRGNEAHPAQ